ncbi:MAG: hypothetical protein A2538_00615 [Candidatus Magasanikbacteria bacterium RIFOXYD2_FULL_41_14]|uniref:Peptidase E n=1 Tax=Candidatus Magasanikbacteria bacterium RIFOXYD2_FULL_41_14 TaxID=1798709 RepID=A0A1F6PC04_9BACT|nr:MAG: hypothetical protein A2538_00615 [Candidatus Magasanikbacteria bacterium RIFOXYD2_FULL_41_14]
MTKYILHGGETSRQSPDNKKFFSEVTNSLSDGATILCIYFSSEKEKWLNKFEQDKLNFSSTTRQKVFKFVLADDKTYTLIEQIKQADAIYLRGGNTEMLKEVLSKVENLGELWQGKVVAASSAGVYVLSKYYYTNSMDDIYNGFGVLPIKTFCHYAEEKSDKLVRLKKYGEDLEVYAIPEEKFFIIER